MQRTKFHGILKEIIDHYPNIDPADFLAVRLGIPIDKAEELAERIEKECNLKTIAATGPNMKKIFVEKTEAPHPTKESAYSVESLSEKEFERFIKWLLEELGYEVQLREQSSDFGFNFVAVKDGEKVLIQARKHLKTELVSNSIVLKSHQTKSTAGCERAIVLATAYFSEQAKSGAQNLKVELWDIDTLCEKIVEVRKKADVEEQSCFPPYKGSLLGSLLRLEETKDFIIEPRADGKYDLHLPGVKYPLLTFQASGEDVTFCVFRIKYNEPVGEFDGETLIRCDHNGDRFGPDDEQAYESIIEYLEQFVE